MELSTVVGIIVIVVVAVLLMKFMGKVLSFIFSIIGIIAIVWLVVIGLRWMDENSIRDNFMDSNNLFLLAEDGNLMTGFATQESPQGGQEPELSDVSAELGNPNSYIYDEYYKVIVVDKEALPEKTALLIDVVDPQDQQALFRSYVENSLLEGDFLANLIDEEKLGDIEVYEETLAFRHGLRDVVGT
ncbi:hypothetical protein KY359_02250 [Candidatus Woesearchaeota archaeon]|nr:hypothetical protein [Candidatus Woesearchaeota archaeon]